MVLLNMYNLASLLYNSGAVRKSLELHEEVLGLRLQLCGKDSQFTLESYESAATIYYLLGNLAKAEFVDDSQVLHSVVHLLITLQQRVPASMP